MKKPVPMSQFLSKYLRDSIGEETSKGLDSIVVTRTCREVLGSTLSNYISEVSFSNGELRIRVSSPVLKNDLFIQRTSLMNKINAALPTPIVNAIYIQ